MQAPARSVTCDLLEALADHKGWLKAPLDVMRDVGPAVRTLGGFLAITKRNSRSTFASVALIAASAGVPTSTARKHVQTLVRRGWLANEGRKSNSRGRPRRTCTISLGKKALAATGDYGAIPLGQENLSWSATAILSIVCRRLMGLRAFVEEKETPNGVRSAIMALGPERWEWSLTQLAEQTGLSRHSCIAGKRELVGQGIVTEEMVPVLAKMDRIQEMLSGFRRLAKRNGKADPRKPPPWSTRCAAQSG